MASKKTDNKPIKRTTICIGPLNLPAAWTTLRGRPPKKSSSITQPAPAPDEVVENLEELEEDGEIYESIEDIWPDYPTKDDFFFNEEEY